MSRCVWCIMAIMDPAGGAFCQSQYTGKEYTNDAALVYRTIEAGGHAYMVSTGNLIKPEVAAVIDGIPTCFHHVPYAMKERARK